MIAPIGVKYVNVLLVRIASIMTTSPTKTIPLVKKRTKMTKLEYLQFHKDTCNRMVSITQAKNADYTGLDDDPFANFSRVEQLGICSVEKGFLTRMSDKFCRIISFAQKGFHEVKEESVEDTLIDLANYCILMAGFLRSRRATTAHVESLT